MECSARVLVFCNQYKPFYLCLNTLYDRLFNDCMLQICSYNPCLDDKYAECIENGGCLWGDYCIVDTDKAIANLPIFKNKQGQETMECKCKPLKRIDVKIVEREKFHRNYILSI